MNFLKCTSTGMWEYVCTAYLDSINWLLHQYRAINGCTTAEKVVVGQALLEGECKQSLLAKAADFFTAALTASVCSYTCRLVLLNYSANGLLKEIVYCLDQV